MAANNNVQIIINQQRELKRGINNWMMVAEKQSLEFFRKSFTNEGFTDNTFSPWKKRQKQVGWPLLNKTGALKNSLKVTSRGQNYFIISSDVKYAAYHNEGTDRLPKREFIGESNTLKRRLDNLFDYMIKKIFK